MAAISSTLLKPIATTSSTNSPITTPSAEPSSFLAGVRQRGSTVPLDFFTPTEETLLKELFGIYHLTSKMDLIDFIGFCCYAELEKVMETVGELSPPQKVCSDADNPTFVFCSNFMYFYLRLLRNSSNNPHQSSLKTINNYSLSESGFIAILSNLLKNTNLKLIQAWTQALAHSSSPIEKEKMIVLYRQGLPHLSRLQILLPLFSKIIGSPYCTDLLMDHNLMCFPGSDKLDQVTEKDTTKILSEIPAVRDIQNFLNFIEFSLNSALKNNSMGIRLLSFSNHLTLLKHYHQQTPSTELIQLWNNIFCYCMEGLLPLHEQCKKSYSRAKEGKLDHKTWLQENNIQARSQKTPEEFLESLHLSHLQVLLIECFEDTVNLMIEHHLFTPLFSNVYRSLDQTIQHFLAAVVIPLELAHHPFVSIKSTPLPLAPFFSSFYQKIDTCLEPLNQFLRTSSLSDVQILIDWYQIGGRLPFITFNQFNRKLLPGCMLTDSILKQLPHLQTHFAQELLGCLKKTSSAEFQKEKTNWLNFTVKQYHLQSMRMFYPITYFKDLELLAAKKTFLKDLNYTVPSELRNYILFQTEIESIFEQAENFLKLAVTPAVEPTPAIALSPDESVTSVIETKSLSQELKQNPLSEHLATNSPSEKSSSPEPPIAVSFPSEPIPAVIDSLFPITLSSERAPSPTVEVPMTEKDEDLLPFKAWVKTVKAPSASSSAPTKTELLSQPKDRKEIMQRLKKAIKVREFEALLREMDYYFLRPGKGSHHIWRNDERDNEVSLPSRPNADISPGVRNSIGKQVFDL